MRFVIFALLLSFLIGCQDVKRPIKPDNLISKDNMVLILSESYTGNAARSINNRIMRDEVIELDSLIFKKFNIDSLQFAQSNAYYASQLNDYIDILKRVEERLVAQKAEIDTLIIREAKIKKDSIDAAREKRKAKKDSISEGITIPPIQN